MGISVVNLQPFAVLIHSNNANDRLSIDPLGPVKGGDVPLTREGVENC